MSLSERPGPEAETPEARQRRLAMRSWRRGIKEMDLILGRFADEQLAAMSADELALYDALLSENDQDLYRWVTGQESPPLRLAPLVARIAAHAEGLTAVTGGPRP